MDKERAELYKKLQKVQMELKVPKNHYNSYGGFSYRSAEDIESAIKPILDENGLALKLSDSIESLGNHEYVRATATVIDLDSGMSEEVYGRARLDESKKGMDSPQLTGSASSYARKYALGGLFLIDDTKDSDAINVGDPPQRIQQKKGSKPHKDAAISYWKAQGKDPRSLAEYAKTKVGFEIDKQTPDSKWADIYDKMKRDFSGSGKIQLKR